MKKRVVTIVLVIAVAAGIISSSIMTSKAMDVAEFDEVKAMIDNMSLHDKVTQMMMVDFRLWNNADFTVMNDEVREIIEVYNFGAIILFANNIKETEQSFNLVTEMQAAATKDEGIPMIITADQEGGSVYRLGSGTALPGNMALGATYTTHGTKYATEAGRIIGSELSALGINSNLAPVVDVNNNANNPVIGLRSYSDDATMVGNLAAATIAGMAEYNVIGCAKHFPGHGDTDTDSHYGLPTVDKSFSELSSNELKPYELAIEQGVEMIMTAHILYPQLEDDKIVSNKTGRSESLPATLSDDILTKLLKEQMGFKGIITTDAMNMAGISSTWDQVQSVIIAIQAGVDMVCMPVSLYSKADLNSLDAVIDGVVDAVNKGTIPMSRIDDAVTRILTVKKNRGILDYDASAYSLERALSVVGGDKNRAMEREIAAAAVTVVKNENNTLPLKLTENSKVLMLVPYSNETALTIMAWNRAKEKGLIPDGAEVDYFRFSNSTISSSLKTKLNWADTYIIISEVSSTARMEYKHWLSSMPNKLCDYAASNGKTAIVASCDKPYDVQLYPNADAILVAYGCKGSSVDPTEALIGGTTTSALACGPNIIAAVEVALGVFGASGKLPLNIPEYDVSSNTYITGSIIYPRGYGLTFNSLIVYDVICVGDFDYTVDGNEITVLDTLPCVIAHLNDGTSVNLPSTNSGDGTYSFSIPFNTSKVVIQAREVTSIAITSLPDKLKYFEGEPLDTTGIEITAYYNNETEELITDYAVSGFNSSVGTNTVTISHGDFTATFDVEVEAICVTSIAITKTPNKLSYFEGEELDVTGLEITAYYNNGTKGIVTDYAINGYTSTEGTKTVIVSYGGYSATFRVTVVYVPSCITSDVYTVDNGYVDRISVGTTAEELLLGIKEAEYCVIFNGNNIVNDHDQVATGMTLKTMNGDVVRATYTLVVIGDVDGNSIISTSDYLNVGFAIKETAELDFTAQKAADVDGDNSITATDYLNIKAILKVTSEV